MTRKTLWAPLAWWALAALVIPGVAAQEGTPEPLPDLNAEKEYVIGVEDELQIVVWGEKDLTLKVKVRPDGKVTVPLIHDIVVAGRTPNEVRAELNRVLGSYLREPNVTVIVTEMNSYRVYFLGELRRPGALNFYRPTRLLQGIAAAGGLTEFGTTIVILREADGKETRIEMDYKKVVAGPHENLYLMPGDTVVVR